jgi:hypothetical protein
LSDKIKKYLKGKEKVGQSKIVIGEGGFGKVRLAMTLTDEEQLAAGVILCVKKTKYVGFNENLTLNSIMNNTLDDLLAD